MMGVFLAGMGLLVCLVSYLQLRWIHQQIQGFFYRCLQVLLVSGDGILFYRFSNQFYRLQQESLRAWILLISTIVLVWFILFALMQGIAFLLEKRRAYKLSLRYILGGCILFTALFVYIGYRQAAPLVLRSYSVTAKMNIVKDLQFYLLSDLHLGSGVDKQRMDQMFAMLEKQPMDALLVAGDLFDEATPITDLQYFCMKCRNASFHDKIYYSPGNHELLSKNRKAYETLLKQSGIHILKDETAFVDHRFYVIGRKDKKERRMELATFIKSCQADKPIIVIDHRPCFDDVHAIDLQISGHTHQGQIFPNTLFTKLAYPYDYGTYQKPYPMIVSSGAGTWGLPIRIGTTSEIVKITLKGQ